MRPYLKSEYVRTFKDYDDIYSFMRGVNIRSARERKKQNISHTPFAWEEEDETDVPRIPSEEHWTSILDRNMPKPAAPAKFKLKHAKFVAAYEEQKKQKKKKKKAPQNISPKGSCSYDYGMDRSTTMSKSSTSIQSMPTSMPSHASRSTPPLGKAKQFKSVGKPTPARTSPPPCSGRIKIGVQTPDWSKVDSVSEKEIQVPNGGKGKTVQVKTPAKSSSTTQTAAKKPYTKPGEGKPKSAGSKGKYIVSQDLMAPDDQPFTGFGYGNKNKETAHKMTANVRAPCDVYSTALMAAKAMQRKKLGDTSSEPVKTKPPVPTLMKRWRLKTGTLYDSEYVSNYTEPDQALMYERRLQSKKIAAKAQKACGVIRKAKK